MIQHRGSFNIFFINNAYKLKNKPGVAQPNSVLNLKKFCVFFSKTQNNENTYLKKASADFVNMFPFLLIMLLIDFIILIRQKIIKKGCFIYKHTIRKAHGISKKRSVFIKNTTCVFLPQQVLKQQQK